MIDILSTLCQSSSYYEQNNYKSDVSQKFLLVLFLTIKETFSFFFFFFGGGVVVWFVLFIPFILCFKAEGRRVRNSDKIFQCIEYKKKISYLLNKQVVLSN